MMALQRFVALLTIIAVIDGQKRCPPQETILPCRCLIKGPNYQIWCSHSDLSNVLLGLKAIGEFIYEPIDELILENNYLPSLPGRCFMPLKVMRLMLRYNNLERVSNDWLSGLEDVLMELYLVEPELRSLPIDNLQYLRNMEAITIKTNSMKRLPRFNGLRKLRYLQFESLSLIELPSNHFIDLLSLQTIQINNSPRLINLEENTLVDLPHLKFINISNCGISWIHPRAITRLPQLRELILNGNKIVDVNMIGYSIRDLPRLEILRLDYNFIDKITEAAFVDLPSLTQLYLSHNRIKELEYGSFHRVPKLRKLDLNYNNLRRVHPESFLQHSGSGLEELWLVHNSIGHVAELRSILDTLPRLIFLDMSFNNLEIIPYGVIRGHPTLERLHLDYNKIHLIDREAFMAMPALRELRLQNNSLNDLFDGPLWNLPALKGLDLSGNYFRRLSPRLLANLPSLRRIDLSRNDLTLVDPESFLMTPDLEHVNLSVNSLVTLHPATFRHLLNLYELDVSSNQLLEFVPNLPRGLEYLHLGNNRINRLPMMPDIDLPSLKMLDLTDNQINAIPNESLQSLPQLRRFYLGGNQLQKLEENSLNGLDRLEVLDLHGNKLDGIHPNSLRHLHDLLRLNLKKNRIDVLYPEMFKFSMNLKFLDVSWNRVAEILPGTFEKLQQIQNINMSHNLLVNLPMNIVVLKNLKYFDLTDNRLKLIYPETLKSLQNLIELRLSKNFINELKRDAFNNLKYLQLLYLDNNELEIIEPNAIHSLPMLKSLFLNQNRLRELPDLCLNNLPRLQHVELQHNHIEIIENAAFNNLPNLVFLNLSYNNLNNFERIGLKSLKSLEMLDISNNQISRMIGPHLSNLIELHLDNNEICAIRGNLFDNMPRLRVLTLRNNKMMSFPERAIQQIRTNIGTLDIDGNPLACGCNLLWLQAWLQETSMLGPRCVDGSYLREVQLLRQNCPIEERNVEVVAPGCEAELLSAPGMFGTSQVFSPWMNLKTNHSKEMDQKRKDHGLAPLPQESEYFYDEYIDYPYNETEFDQDFNGNKTNFVDNNKKSPHFTTGDTPTIYAAIRNKTKPNVTKPPQNSPSSSGFTFFGVPLPNINLNNLLGKKPPLAAERKTAIVNKPPEDFRKATFELMPKTTRPALLSSPTTVRPNGPRGGFLMYPPDRPSVETGGFVPLLPGSGGFRPIPKPIVQPESESSNVKVKQVVNQHEISATTETNQIDNRTAPTLIRKSEIIGGHPIPPPTSIITTTTTVAQNRNYTKFQFRQESTQASAKIEKVVNSNREGVVKSIPIATTSPPSTTMKILTTPTTTIRTTTTPIITTTATTTTTTTTTTTGTPKTTTTLPKSDDQLSKGPIGTPLSALMIPNVGQQSEFRSSLGRSTITKVPSPHISGTAPLLASNRDGVDVSEPLAHNRKAKIQNDKEMELEKISSSNQKNKQISSDTDWYFANYNRTNLEPYVGVVGDVYHAKGVNLMASYLLIIVSSHLVFVYRYIINC